MNSKERILRAIRHEEIDRIPYFYLGTGAINQKMAEHLGLRKSRGVDIIDYFDCDIVMIDPIPAPKGVLDFQPGYAHAKIHMEDGHEKLVPVTPPLKNANSVDAILNANCWPDPAHFIYEIPSQLLKSSGKRAIVAKTKNSSFLYAMSVRGVEQIMIDMALNPELAHAIFGKISDISLERTRRFLTLNADYVDILGIGDDVAGQNGMLISVKMWRTFLKLHLEKLVLLCNEFDVIPYFHGCGGFRDIFNDLIDMGITCIGRLQTEAKGNDFADLVAIFGDRACLWGGIDAQHVVIEGDETKIRSHVNSLAEVGGGNGRFILGPTHTFTEDTPVENIIQVYATLREQV